MELEPKASGAEQCKESECAVKKKPKAKQHSLIQLKTSLSKARPHGTTTAGRSPSQVVLPPEPEDGLSA